MMLTLLVLYLVEGTVHASLDSRECICSLFVCKRVCMCVSCIIVGTIFILNTKVLKNSNNRCHEMCLMPDKLHNHHKQNYSKGGEINLEKQECLDSNYCHNSPAT